MTPIEAAKEWMRTRPPEVKELMRAFPPSCEVSVTPLPGESLFPDGADYLVAYSYIESEEDEGARVGVIFPMLPMSGRYQVPPERIVVVGWHTNDDGEEQTPAWVASVLDAP